MRGTVKQFKDMLEEMKTVYKYKDENTWLSTHGIISRDHDTLEITTRDEKTGVTVTMAKQVEVEDPYVR